MHWKTRLLNHLPQNIYQELLDEALAKPFFPHANGSYEETGPLRHGLTAYIRNSSISGDDEVYFDLLEYYPRFHSFIKQTFKTEKIGRAYWHWLKPGQSIDKHNDATNYFYRTDRFQLFPIIDSDNHVVLYKDVKETYSNGALIAFSSKVFHAYENRSEMDWYFLVFDLYPGEYVDPTDVGG